MDSITNYPLFLLTGLLLNMTPGADTIYILSRTLSQGRRAGVASVLGISTGSLVHTFCAGLGLSAVLDASASAFIVVKWAGALYLLYLGVRMLRSRGCVAGVLEARGFASPTSIYLQGFLTNILNPKVALFFVALIPQFIVSPATATPAPFFFLGGSFVLTGTIWCMGLVFVADFIGARLQSLGSRRRLLERVTGLVFIGLAARLALHQRP